MPYLIYNLFQRQITNVQIRIEKNKQRIIAAANAEENLEARTNSGRIQPPTDPDALQAWLNDTRAKVCVLIPLSFLNRF